MRAFSLIRPVFALSLIATVFASIHAGAETGSATTTMSLIVPVVTSVSCASAPVTAPTGNQTNTLAVVCTITGNPNSMAAMGNSFSPSSVTMTNASSQTLSATLQTGITSPDSSITGITGNSSGFREPSVREVPGKSKRLILCRPRQLPLREPTPAAR
jgi:hypothetical protein